MKIKEFLIDTFTPSFLNPLIIKALDLQRKLYEGLEKSYAPEEFIHIIEKEDPTCIINYSRTIPGSMLIVFKNPDKDKINKIAQKIEYPYGWFSAGVDIIDKKTKKSLISDKDKKNIKDTIDKLSTLTDVEFKLFIEAKYNLEVTNYMLKKYKFLYHLTPTINVKKILKMGLKPSTKSKLGNHPERIYFASDKSSTDFLKIQFIEKTKINDWTLLKVDVSFLQNIGGGRLLLDPQFMPDGVFTLSNIHPKYITIIE